ncbi:MAG: DNA-directed polymerase alpha subunit [Burkholderiales bacterium]|nr:DNA-directed polymerase alpha subunit [Burkholderiales bacterium]
MIANDFVHLRLHTEFSVTEGVLRIKDAVDLSVSHKMPALPLTDLHNMFGLVKFYKACRSKGIKPLIGAEINVQGNDDTNHYKILVLIKNLNGYRELCRLITRSYTENKILDIPYVKDEWLLDTVHHDLIVLSGGINGDIGHLIINNKPDLAKARAKEWANAFPDSYYIELQRFSHDLHTNLLISHSVNLASGLNIPVVATHPIAFAMPEDYLAHEVRVCVADSEQYDDERRKSRFSPDQYFMSPKQMCQLFADIPESITNTVEIAKRCNLEITLGKYFLPDFKAPNGLNLNEYLHITSEEGLKKRLQEIYADESERSKNAPIFQSRLDLEIKTIIQMGFAGYFLIVADFINWAKQNNIPVGPGRGSGAGSLVAFALGITDIEPLRYGLLFERFLNPERVSMPDFDIDFCQEKRELVIEYVKDKYGANAVAQIATFGTMSSKAVIKDVGRALALPYGLCDSLSKLILNTPIKSFSLDEAYDKFPDLKDKIDNADDEVKRLWDLSKQLEDLTRSVGKHAAGVLIAPSDLTDFCPLYLADGMQTSQLDKDDVESVGLVKFDFLGLRNLTIIQDTLNNIKILHKEDVKLSNYQFDDKGVYELLRSGNTQAVFQLESGGMKRVLTKLEPDRFEDIIAILALYRPGPLGSGMVDDFIRRKKGIDKPDYFHDDLRECLETTYGVIVYQEQVMQISQIIGGYTLGGADLLRRAMGKKKPEEMAKHKNLFIEGALKKGYTAELAEHLFDLMAKFAEYGFNKSHSAAYAVVSYHTAYLKAHYLSCFMAATLSSELDKTDKLYEFYQDCQDNDLTILPSDINHSVYQFQPIDKVQIRYALGAIKGVGRNVAELIVQEREKNGEFVSFYDFCTRVDKKAINKKTLESLVKAGAFDNLEPNRSILFNNIGRVMDEVTKLLQNANQATLFDMFAEDDVGLGSLAAGGFKLEEYPAWTLKEMLSNEKQALGFYFSASLFDEYRDIVHKLGIEPLSHYGVESEAMQDLINGTTRERQKVLVCGVINYMGSRPLKKGGKMHFINIEDDSGSLEFVVYDSEFDKFKHLLKMDELIFVSGELMYDAFRNQIKVTAKNIASIDDILPEQINNVILNIDDKFAANNLAGFLAPNGAKLTINYSKAEARCKITVGDAYRFVPNYTNLSKVNELLGKHSWSIN